MSCRPPYVRAAKPLERIGRHNHSFFSANIFRFGFTEVPTENQKQIIKKENSIADCSVIASDSNKLVDSYSIHAFCTVYLSHETKPRGQLIIFSSYETRRSSRESGNLHFTGTVPWCLGSRLFPEFITFSLLAGGWKGGVGGEGGGEVGKMPWE